MMDFSVDDYMRLTTDERHLMDGWLESIGLIDEPSATPYANRCTNLTLGEGYVVAECEDLDADYWREHHELKTFTVELPAPTPPPLWPRKAA